MKIKEVEQTANIAWSPASQYPIYLATGTAAQQLDASFSTTSQIDLYSLDLNEPGLGMGLKASISTKQRYISVSITLQKIQILQDFHLQVSQVGVGLTGNH
jgi:protein transport protein SEC31